MKILKKDNENIQSSHYSSEIRRHVYFPSKNLKVKIFNIFLDHEWNVSGKKNNIRKPSIN